MVDCSRDWVHAATGNALHKHLGTTAAVCTHEDTHGTQGVHHHSGGSSHLVWHLEQDERIGQDAGILQGDGLLSSAWEPIQQPPIPDAVFLLQTALDQLNHQLIGHLRRQAQWWGTASPVGRQKESERERERERDRDREKETIKKETMRGREKKAEQEKERIRT